MKDINIQPTKATEIAIPNKTTVYICIYWINGVMFSNTPSKNKLDAENYAYSMGKHSDYCTIYKFEIDTPIIGKII